jgi:hypothetical protein
MNLSVVVVTYRRLKRLNQILTAWLRETPDVWLCDCSAEGFKTSLPIKYVYAKPDPGNRIRHAVALLTSGAWVVKADDDIVPYAGLGADFLKWGNELGPCIMGIHGRTFHGPHYYSQTRMVTSKTLALAKAKPQAVDFVGVITCAPRAFLAMDLRRCQTEVEDLYWQMARFPKVPKYVIPTGNFFNLDEAHDKGRLCGTKPSRDIRIGFYRDWYNRNYARKA